ncbi:type VI secretion system baseplate subunit TssK [Candidatus Poribacteria bacterium]|nr:type VI secretion system baseplate subunit TssK [Candidatus Poribacteria bacterium]
MARYPHYRPVVWSEGMFLTPHHFQQTDRYHEYLLNCRLLSMHPFGWGVIEWEVNREKLAKSHFTLETFQGIFRSGTPVNIPGVDDAPASRTVESKHFASSSTTLDVYLALPVEHLHLANCHLLEDGEGGNEKRYIQEFVPVFDGNTGKNEQEVAIAKKNLRILFAGEPSDNYERLKIAEVVRAADGSLALKRDCIPPCLVISASPYLMKSLEDLIDVLTTKGVSLSAQCQRRTAELYEFSGTDLTTPWLLHTIHSFLPVLKHFCHLQRIHPEEVFRSLSQLAGAFSIFAVKINPGHLPQYDHEHLSSTFMKLNQTIRDLLSLITPFQKSKRIPLQEQKTQSPKRKEVVFAVEVEEQWLLLPYRFYLAMKIEDEDLINTIPDRIQIASMDEIDLLIRLGVAGINVTFLDSALLPQSVSKVPGYAYFRLEGPKEYWESVQTSKTLAIYTDKYQDLLAELIVAEE